MSNTNGQTTWFLAQLKPNCHLIADRNLTRQGFRTFLPTREETKRALGKFTTQTRPLFPGYIFVALDVLQGSWRAVNSTYGITRLVSLDKEPTAVPSDLVTQLMSRCDREGKLLPPKLFKAGDQVMVTKGPFIDFLATIESVASDQRVYVLMELMGGHTRVGVNTEHLHAV